jgi:exonuclease VII small subunit
MKKQHKLTSEQARKMASRPRRPRTIKVAVRDLLECSDAQELKSEMEEWRDNMDGANMTHLPKYEEVSEAADECENVVDELEQGLSNLIEALEKHDQGKTLLDTALEVSNRRVSSRADRAGEISERVGAAADAIKAEFGPETEEHSLADEVAEGAEAVGMVNFPGMY